MDGATKSNEPASGWQLLAASWQLLRQYYEAVLFLFILPGLLYILGTALVGDGRQLQHWADFSGRQRVGLAVIAAASLWSLVNLAPSVYFRLQAARQRPVSLGQCYRQGFRHLWRLLGLYAFFALTIVGGLALAVVPGLVALYLIVSRYYLAGYYVVDQNMGIRQALRRCGLETAPYRPAIWSIFWLQQLFNLLSAVAGLLFLDVGAAIGVFIALVPLFLPPLRYYEIRRK